MISFDAKMIRFLSFFSNDVNWIIWHSSVGKIVLPGYCKKDCEKDCNAVGAVGAVGKDMLI